MTLAAPPPNLFNVKTFALCLLLWTPLLTAEPFDHAVWDTVLQARVNELGEVDYKALQASPQELNRYLELLAASSPDSAPDRFPGRDHEVAYWINAYNAFTIQGALDHYPLESIRKVNKFFNKRVYVAGRTEVSLDDIEHEILRGKYKEPRIHFAIVCASVSCPALWNRAVTGENLDKQLDALARTFVNQRRNLDVDVDRNEATLSKIFDWFQGDFELATGVKGPAAVLSFVRPYADSGLAKSLAELKSPKVRYFPYDWSLNRPGSRKASPNRLEVSFSAESGAQP